VIRVRVRVRVRIRDMVIVRITVRARVRVRVRVWILYCSVSGKLNVETGKTKFQRVLLTSGGDR
jgi:hypothetical protein